jgi:hypothetical protein
MMARIRTIKPEFFRSEQVGDLMPLCRLLFIGLWTQADREGRLEDRPRRLKAELFPYDDVDVDVLLGELQAAGLIIRYEAGGRCLIQVTAFLKHQAPNIKEAPSILPAPPENRASTVPAQCQHGTSISSRAPKEWKGRERKGRERGKPVIVERPEGTRSVEGVLGEIAPPAPAPPGIAPPAGVEPDPDAYLRAVHAQMVAEKQVRAGDFNA